MLYSCTAVVFNVGENTPRGRFGDLRRLHFFLKIVKWPNNHNIDTTTSSHWLSRQ